MGNSMAATNATDVNRTGGVPISLKWLSFYVLNADKLRAVTTALAPASCISNPQRTEMS
jgi:hypothetical protein